METMGGMTREEHYRAIAYSMAAQPPKGTYLDLELQQQIRKRFPKKQTVLSVADYALSVLCLGPESLPCIIQDSRFISSQEDLIRYYLCLFEVARSIVGKPIPIEADYKVVKGREYGLSPHKDRATQHEIPYIEGVRILAVWLKKYE